MPNFAPFRFDTVGTSSAVVANFGVLKDVIARPVAEQPTVITGSMVFEEINSAFGGYSQYPRQTLFGTQGITVFDLLGRSYRGRMSELRRVSEFSRGYSGTVYIDGRHASLSGSLSRLREIYATLEFGEFSAEMESRYVDSRRSKDGARSQISHYVDSLLSMSVMSPITMIVGHRFSYEQQILLWRWANEFHKFPLIVATSANGLGKLRNVRAFERSYINLDDFLREISIFLNTPRSYVNSAFSSWSSRFSHDIQALLKDNCVTQSYAERFLEYAKNLPPIDSSAGQNLLVPAQRVAPIIFEFSGGQVGLARSPSSIGANQITGATRALISLATDVLASGGLENAVPNYRVKLGRILSTLQRISTNGADEADVVELGIESSAFERRIHEGRDRIGELSLGEAVAFVAESRSFLSRFAAWTEYNSRTQMSSSKNSEEAAEISRELMERFSQIENAITPEARDRIQTLAEPAIKDTDDPLQREGYSASAENMLSSISSVASKAVKIGGNEIADIANETKKEAKKEISKNIVKFFSENASQLLRLSALRDAKWLEIIVNLFS